MRKHSASVFVSLASLHKGGNITGEIWLEVAGFAFPERRWSDFPVIILGWWLDALFKLWSGKKKRIECLCLFMDGPYGFEVSGEKDAYVLRCYRDPFDTRECEWEGAISLTNLLRQVLDAASIIIKECRRQGWATKDLEALESRWVYMDGVLNPQSV
ncbi:MAG TPA: hypothetical protein VN493_21720 [Thermoanaerobaculia bacterium]|nr:hypothetical protein [Thermoanaerobaculia bacterium]